MKHKLFSIGSSVSYMMIDFAIIAISIMVSYKFYRVMDFGRQAFLPEIGNHPPEHVVRAFCGLHPVSLWCI